MFNKSFLFTALISFTLFSCQQTPEQVTHKDDYEIYLEADADPALEVLKQDLVFWQAKLEKDPQQFPYLVQLAGSQSQLFEMTGKIDYLILAGKNLEGANKKTKYAKAGYLKALARNYISQHRFKDALEILKSAEITGEKLAGTQKMLFDVHMELGNYEEAEVYLTRIEDRTDFDFLIRYAKWSDHNGDLGTAITYMEKATERAETANLKSLKQWSYTNLADFYGHNGEIEKSYEHYLKALELDPTDAYAKKGIAWIVYSHERNPQEALRILNAANEHHQAPDYFLLRAEIAEFQNDDLSKKQYLEQYFSEVSNKNYGAMYNSPNSLLLAEDGKEMDKALVLAHQEITNRPTPQSYDLLAWTYYNKGEYKQALAIAEQHVENRTFEPAVLYHLAKIYKANGKEAKAKNLKKELLESLYELGPGMEGHIQKI
ncbi:tetratricopeptide repeat protein [Salinimicrobium oceani]|uniref:Cell surface protein n=2 Tax=Flavobacteriaceae TaxID=49546 RepID=A0ABX1D3H0_9FLAO|nr:cell surface protein [Salinimicrobium oceani]NJW53066.1 cell surface protein [Salinimicrobium oceani]